MSDQKIWSKGDRWKVKWTSRSQVTAALRPDPIVMNESSRQNSIKTEDILEYEVLNTDRDSTIISLKAQGDYYELYLMHEDGKTYLKKVTRKSYVVMEQKGMAPLFTPEVSTGLIFDFPVLGGDSQMMFKDLTGRACRFERTQKSAIVTYQISYQFPAGPKVMTTIEWKEGAKWWRSFRRESLYQDPKGEKVIDLFCEGRTLSFFR